MKLLSVRWLTFAAAAFACNGGSGTPTGPSVPEGGIVIIPDSPDGGGGSVRVSEASLDFGLADCGGAPPADKVVSISGGTNTVQWSAELESPDFTILGASSGSFAAGASASVTIHANPVAATTPAGTTLRATLIITTDQGKNFRIPLTMKAQGATISVLPATVDFGQLPLNVQAPDIALTIKNTGNKEVDVSLSAPQSTDFTMAWQGSPADFKLAPGATVTGAVARFRPTTLQAVKTSSNIVVKGAVCGQSASEIPIQGQGTGGVVGVSPGTLDFGYVDCGTRANFQVFSILNNGNAAFDWNATLGKAALSDFAVSPASGTVFPGNQVLVFVTPKAIPKISAVTNNLYGDTLRITTTAPNDTPHDVPLLMTARGAILGFSASSIAFGQQLLFGGGTANALTVSNTGNAPATVTLATTTTSYRVAPSAPTPIAGGANLAATVTFEPVAFGAVPDTVSVATSDVLCQPLPAAVSLTGTGKGSATAVAVGGGQNRWNNAQSTCAILTGGHVACWGDNRYGQLGVGARSDTPSPTPQVIPNLAGVTSIAAGGEHFCAIGVGGAVYCWGRGDRGQLGGGSGDRSSPGLVSNITNATAIAVDHKASCAVAGGLVYCWGSNHRGQLGNGAGGNGVESRTPVQVTGLNAVTAIGMAGFGACALLGPGGDAGASGGVRCWGYNQHGMLGNGSQTQALTPVVVSGLTDAIAIDAGGRGARNGLACAVRSGGTVSCWGDGRHAKINGVDTYAVTTPTQIAGIANATSVTVGAQHMCALIDDGTVRCWGRGNVGQLGNGATPDSSGPVAVTGLTGVTQISAGGGSTCARRSNGEIYCWGANDFGQLGNPNAAGSTPSLVSGF